MNRRIEIITVVILLSILAFQCVFSMMRKSPVCDEVSHHIATGYSFLKTRDFRLNSTSPPLTEELAALPLLFINPHLPLEDDSWKDIDRVGFGYKFLYVYNENAERIVFLSRLPMVVLSLCCGFLVFVFAKELYGRRAAISALFLYAFSPTIIAYSRLDTPDIGAAFFMLLAIYRFYKYIRKPNLKNVLLSGMTLGLAQACKLSALLLIPVFFIIVLWKSLSAKKARYLLRFIPIILLTALVIFGAYFGEVKPFLENDIDVEEKITYIEKAADRLFPGNAEIREKAVDFALSVPIPFSTYLMNILAEANMVFVKDYGVYLFGRRSASGWWYYYPAVFFLKTPIPLIIMLFLALLLPLGIRASDRWAGRILFLFFLGFALACLLTKLQLSVRYILPLYPLFFVYASKLAKCRKRIILLIVSALSLWYLAESVSIYPDYLSYFNQLAGGPDKGWRYLRDANIDYGQDLPLLAGYMDSNGINEIILLYSGTAEPGYYNIEYKDIREAEKVNPRKKVYAISVNCIDSVKWAGDRHPEAKAGKSIFIYDLRQKRL